MPELQKTVAEINNNLKAAFNLKGRPVKLFGIVELLSKDEEHEQPVLVVGKEGEEAAFNDNFCMSIYHRKLSVTYEDQEGFGDEVAKRESASMLLVCHCDPDKMRVDRSRIDTLMALKLSSTITATYGDETIVSNVGASLINTSAKAVFNQEFPGYEFSSSVDAHHLLFSIQYQIVTDFDASCIDLCAEC